mmetsp:Transcript_40228/g.106728  ORF Transcript_40228/g.106728 Transcript_40228/m.106728 type:complete len:319 (-) Transcript_40228:1662-2618(-)
MLPGQSLNPCCAHLLTEQHEILSSLPAAKQRLHMAREHTDSLVHLSRCPAPPTRLNESGALDQQLKPCKLQSLVNELLEENEGLANGPCDAKLWINVEFFGKVFQKLFSTSCRIAEVFQTSNHRRCADHLVIVPTLLMIDAHRVPCTADLHNLQHTTIPQLLRHTFSVVEIRHVLRIWFDATNEMRLSGVNDFHQTRELFFELRRHGVLLFLLLTLVLLGEDRHVLDIRPEKVRDEGARARAHALDGAVGQLILVLVHEGIRAVLHRPSEVLDNEPRGFHLDLVHATVTFVGPKNLVAEGLVRTPRNDALLVKHGEDT